jgi:hypothetical protein
VKRSLACVCACVTIVASVVVGAPVQALATTCAEPTSGPGLQFLLNHTASGGTLCIDSGTYTIGASLTLPVPMTVIGTGPTTPVIECAAAVYCVNGAAGPDDVVLQNLVLQNASKADVQIGIGTSSTPVTGWWLQGITVTGGGQAGIAMNTAADITVSDSTVARNGSTPYDVTANPTGDFGLRANRVDSLTVKDSLFVDNPVTNALQTNLGFSGGAKFDTDTNLLVQHNTFTGNAGGGQLWVDISSDDFHLIDNAIDATPNGVTGLTPNEGIRVEVSCGGQGGSTVESNQVQGGALGAIDLFDSNGISVTDNEVTVPNTGQANFGIRMYGNVHGVIPASGCDSGGVYPNRNNVASGNDISMVDTGNAVNGVENDPGGISENNVWSDNTYTVRHCYGLQWTWWDGATEQDVDFAAWQGFGQDAGGAANCTSVIPEIDGTDPFDPTWGPAGTTVTIHGTGMVGVTSVKFNKKAAAIISTSASEVVAIVPAAATTGTVCVKDALQMRCSTTNFTVAPIVSVSGVLPTSGLPGAAVAISGQAFTGSTGVTFAGHPASFTFASDTEIDATVPPDATPGPVCVIMPIQGTVCGADAFSVLPPAAPVMMSPVGRFQLDPFAATWMPSQGASSYGVTWRSAPYNAGFAAWSVPTGTTGTSQLLPFAPGNTTCVMVTAVDGGGSTPGPQTCTAVPLDDRGLTPASGTWTKLTGVPYYRGTATRSKFQNSTLTLTGVKVVAITLVIEARPSGGSVDVLLNGQLLRTVSTAATVTQDRKLVSIASWPTLHTGTITIRVHTAGKPVVIDGLALSRSPI